MRPLRQKRLIEVTDGPVAGQERILEASDEVHVLSDEGSVDTLNKRERHPCDCGCFSPVGGRCYECGAITCVRCHGHCSSCGKPICLEHSVAVDVPGDQRVRFCGSCYTGLARKQRLARITRFLLSPFVRFEK